MLSLVFILTLHLHGVDIVGRSFHTPVRRPLTSATLLICWCLFASIPGIAGLDTDRASPGTLTDDPVGKAAAGQLVRVVPEGDRHVIELQWAVPPEQRLYREAPAAYLSHLLGCAPYCEATFLKHFLMTLISRACRRAADKEELGRRNYCRQIVRAEIIETAPCSAHRSLHL